MKIIKIVINEKILKVKGDILKKIEKKKKRLLKINGKKKINCEIESLNLNMLIIVCKN